MARSRIDKGVTLIATDTATLVISEEGCVAGEVRVPNVVINGMVEGNVYASHRVELAPQAKVKGNLYYKLIEMHLGAMVDGQLVHEEAPGKSDENVHPLPLEGQQSD